MSRNFERQLFAIAAASPPSTVKRGDIARATAALKAATSASTGNSQAASGDAFSPSASNTNESSPLYSVLTKWKQSDDDDVHTLLVETNSAFDRVATQLLSAAPSSLSSSSSDDGTITVCEQLWDVMSQRASTLAVRFLTTCLQFMASSESALEVPSSSKGDEQHEDDGEEREAGEHWFATATALFRILSRNNNNNNGNEEDDVLPTPALRHLAKESFWTALRGIVSCIESSQRLLSCVFAGNKRTRVDDASLSVVAQSVADALLLRIDFHFGGGASSSAKSKSNSGSDDDDDDIAQDDDDEKTARSSPRSGGGGEDFSHRPEHLLQYIGTQWILLRCLSIKLSINSSSSSNSNSVSHLMERRYSAGASHLFNRICIAPIIAKLEASAATPLLDLITSAAVKVAASSSSAASQRETEQKKDLLDNLLGGNVRLLHVLNVLSEAVRQVERSIGHAHSSSSASSFPCLDLLTDAETAVVPAALIAAMRDYCTGVLETASAAAAGDTPLSRVMKVATESAWEQVVTVAKRGRINKKSSSNNNDGDVSIPISHLFASSDDQHDAKNLVAGLGQLRPPEIVATCMTMAVSLSNSVKPLLTALPSTATSSSDPPPIFTSLFLHIVVRETILSHCATHIAQDLALLGSQFVATAAVGDTVIEPPSESFDPPHSLQLSRVLAAFIVKACIPLLEFESFCAGDLPSFLQRECKVSEAVVSQLVAEPCARVIAAMRSRVAAVMTKSLERRGDSDGDDDDDNRMNLPAAAAAAAAAEKEEKQLLRVSEMLVRSVVSTCLKQLLLVGHDSAAKTEGRLLSLLLGKVIVVPEENDVLEQVVLPPTVEEIAAAPLTPAEPPAAAVAPPPPPPPPAPQPVVRPEPVRVVEKKRNPEPAVKAPVATSPKKFPSPVSLPPPKAAAAAPVPVKLPSPVVEQKKAGWDELDDEDLI